METPCQSPIRTQVLSQKTSLSVILIIAKMSLTTFTYDRINSFNTYGFIITSTYIPKFQEND